MEGRGTLEGRGWRGALKGRGEGGSETVGGGGDVCVWVEQ